MEERFTQVVCADILLMNNDKILLMKRKNTGNDDGYYELPGGHLEANEDIFDAMIREAKEELLIDIDRNDLEIAHIMHHYTGGRINFIFKTEKYYNPQIGEPNKCEELVWVNIHELPELTTRKVKRMINNIINNQLYDYM